MTTTTLKLNKVVSSLPDELEPNAIYYVRTGTGIKTYVSDATGSVAYTEDTSDSAQSESSYYDDFFEGYIPKSSFVGTIANNTEVRVNFPTAFSKKPDFIAVTEDSSNNYNMNVLNVTNEGFGITFNYMAALSGVWVKAYTISDSTVDSSGATVSTLLAKTNKNETNIATLSEELSSLSKKLMSYSAANTVVIATLKFEVDVSNNYLYISTSSFEFTEDNCPITLDADYIIENGKLRTTLSLVSNPIFDATGNCIYCINTNLNFIKNPIIDTTMYCFCLDSYVSSNSNQTYESSVSAELVQSVSVPLNILLIKNWNTETKVEWGIKSIVNVADWLTPNDVRIDSSNVYITSHSGLTICENVVYYDSAEITTTPGVLVYNLTSISTDGVMEFEKQITIE